MTHRLVALAALIAGIILTATPAHAETYSPSVWAPIANTDGGPVVVQLDAPADSWQIRQSARRLAAQVPGIEVRTTGDCTTADVCVHVVVGAYDAEAQTRMAGVGGIWGGLTTWDDEHDRTVYLNTATMPVGGQRVGGRLDRLHVAAHEFGHVLGLDHHTSPGLLSTRPNRMANTLSVEEVALLTSLYSG